MATVALGKEFTFFQQFDHGHSDPLFGSVEGLMV